MKNKLFVGNLSWSVDDDMLNNIFQAHGEIVSAHVAKDRETGRSRGFGFVEFADDASAEAASKALDQTEVEGRTINVSIARPKE